MQLEYYCLLLVQLSDHASIC